MSQLSTNPENPRDSRRWLGIAQTGLIVLFIVVALFFARAPERAGLSPIIASGDMVPVVYTIAPSPVEHVQHVDLTGTVTLDRKLTVVSRVVGHVVWVSPEFVNGGTILANEVFVRIDPRDYEIEVRAAEMMVASSEALLQQARQDASSDADLAISVADARLGQAEAALDLARLRLEQTEISLPFDARVISSELEIGKLVGPPEAVGKLSILGIVYRPDALQVRVPITAEDLASLDPAIGRIAEVDTVNGIYDAELARISSIVALESRLAHVFLKFSSEIPLEKLPVPGTFAEVRIVGQRLSDVFMLPEAAERENGSIWIVADGALRKFQPVTLGRTFDGWIVEAFDPGDGVVVSALAGASEGLKVTPNSAPSSQ